MVQAVVCKEEIGWRDNSRRILLVATDIGFHMAGDGAVCCKFIPIFSENLMFSQSIVLKLSLKFINKFEI
jgi:hypothetical protein